MSTNEQVPDRLLVAIHDQTAFIHVQGRGSFKISTALKQFGISAIDSQCRRILLDMRDCVGMDSTFMGVLAGLAFLLKKVTQGDVVMIHIAPRTRALMSTLGLDQIVKAYLAGAEPADLKTDMDLNQQMTELGRESDQRTIAETMLQAHESLVELEPGNLPKFRDVLTFLRQDIRKLDDQPPKKP